MREAEVLALREIVWCGGNNLGYCHGFEFQFCCLLAVQM